MALGAWVGDPGAAVPIVPQAKIFLPRELAALGYLRVCYWLVVMKQKVAL